MKTILAIVMISACLFAADKKPKLEPVAMKPPGTPSVSAEAEIRYWRAALDFNAAKPGYDKADAALKAAVADLIAACGEKMQPNTGTDRIVCVPKPKQ